MELAKKAAKGGKKAAAPKKVEEAHEEAKEEAQEDEEIFDLEDKVGFDKALKAKLSRPFIFGPVEFNDLNTEDAFEYEKERARVEGILARSTFNPSDICIHGYDVTVKRRNLKRKTQILKHARFLPNLVVTPKLPPVKEVT